MGEPFTSADAERCPTRKAPSPVPMPTRWTPEPFTYKGDQKMGEPFTPALAQQHLMHLEIKLHKATTTHRPIVTAPKGRNEDQFCIPFSSCESTSDNPKPYITFLKEPTQQEDKDE
jgi:hypothetical protein